MSVQSSPARRPRVSPLRYPGGKASLYPRLREIIRRNDLTGCTYVEPYAGGAGAALALLATGQVERVVLNDLDPAIHSFWRVVTEDPNYLRRNIERVELSVTEWRKQKAIYAKPQPSSWRQLGFATFFLNRTNRSGVLNGGPIGGLDQSGNYKIDARFNREDLIERIRIIQLYRDRIAVTCRDGRDVIRAYAKRSKTFIYADPPYFEKAGTLYLNNFSAADHKDLAGILNGLAMRNWLLTYDNVPQVAQLYPTRRRCEFELHYSARDVRRAKELAVVSDTLEELGSGWPLRGDLNKG